MMSTITENAQATNRTNATIPVLKSPVEEVLVPTPAPLPMRGIDMK